MDEEEFIINYKNYKIDGYTIKGANNMSLISNGTWIQSNGGAALTGLSSTAGITADSLAINIKKKYVHLLAVTALYIGPRDIQDRVVYLNENTSVINDKAGYVDTQLILLQHAAEINDALTAYNERNKPVFVPSKESMEKFGITTSDLEDPITLAELKIRVTIKESHEVIE